MSMPQPGATDDPQASPASYPIAGERMPARRRAIFPRGFAALDEHHAAPPIMPAGEPDRRRRIVQDDSLRLIDDLTNLSVDPMFSDSRLSKGPRSAIEVWATRVVVFLVCIAVGFLGSLFVQKLNTDPRKPIRQSLAGQLRESTTQVDELAGQIDQMQSEIDKRTASLGAATSTRRLTSDSLVSGSSAVHGEGVSVTLANPLAASSENTTGSVSVERLRVITDIDLQQIVSLLWQSGAEAIAVNGNRLGTGTSIRAAGGSILVGLTAVESPYVIEAIGPSKGLQDALDSASQPNLHESFLNAGITMQTKREKDITLKAAVSGELQYARKVE